jgi:hypothetical protein
VIKKLGDRIKTENWWRHLLTFTGTVIGIIIALELDKRKENLEEQEKLASFLTMVDNELLINRGLIHAEQIGLETNLAMVNWSKGKLMKSGNIKASILEVDSLMKKIPKLRERIIRIKTISSDTAIFTTELVFEGEAQLYLDAWELVKSSGLVARMNPFTVYQYMEIYKQIGSKNNLVSQTKFLDIYTESWSDNVLQDDELLIIKEYLEILISIAKSRVDLIDFTRKNIEGFNNASNFKKIIIDPNDSLKLKWIDIEN